MQKWLVKLASPKSFYQITGRLLPWLALFSSLLFTYGLIVGLLFVPPDYQQGNAFRIIYLHVPSAVMSLTAYVVMAVSAAVFLIWKIKLADVIAKVSAPLGASFTFLALITGSLWGKPMWGTWWIWDARLTSELILLFLYSGVIALRSAIPEPTQAAKASSLLTIIGLIDIPIIHYSVYWWNTLHQQATVLKLAKPSIAPEMLYPLLAMLLAFMLYYFLALLIGARYEVLARERQARWVQEL
ncbi:MAG: heme ABC transporter permease CcmC [Gammaproteobacteria bacterium]